MRLLERERGKQRKEKPEEIDGEGKRGEKKEKKIIRKRRDENAGDRGKRG